MSDFAPVGIDEYGRVQIGGGDARLWVKFSKRARKNDFRSSQEGRPIYEEVDYIQIQQPGERDQVVRPVRDEDKFRFPKQWAAYQADAEQVPEGTPVAHLFPNDPGGTIVALLRDLKILTVEQLAELTEHGIQKLGMDGRKYVNRALAYLDKAKNMAEVNKLSAEVENLLGRVKILEDANKRLAAERDEARARAEDADDRPRQPRKPSGSRPTVFDPPPAPPEPPPRPDPYIAG